MAQHREILIFADSNGKDVRIYSNGKRREWPVSIIGYRTWLGNKMPGQIIKISVPRHNALLVAVMLNIGAIVLALSAIAMTLLK